MGWATHYIAKLQAGETITFRPRGHSMTGKVNNGQLVTVEPLREDHILTKGDIVLCKVSGSQYLHLVHAVKSNGKQFVIGNNHNHINGTITRDSIFGICVKVED